MLPGVNVYFTRIRSKALHNVDWRNDFRVMHQCTKSLTTARCIATRSGTSAVGYQSDSKYNTLIGHWILAFMVDRLTGWLVENWKLVSLLKQSLGKNGPWHISSPI